MNANILPGPLGEIFTIEFLSVASRIGRVISAECKAGRLLPMMGGLLAMDQSATRCGPEGQSLRPGDPS